MKALFLGLWVAIVAAGCGSPTSVAGPWDQRPAEAIGTVAATEAGIDSTLVTFRPDPGYEYFDGTVFDLMQVGGLVDSSGESLSPGSLVVGDRIEVWVDACAESFPVQCSNPRARLLD